ncbi:MAG: DEAD/DEAH box helicase family protein [Luteolibacter sp.]
MGNRPGAIHSPASGGGRRAGGVNYRIGGDLGGGSLKEKCRANFAAIELLHNLQRENRPATPEEQGVLVRYVGWGGLPQVFATHDDPAWQAERERLRELLGPEEIRAARASTLNAHYTSPTVIAAMYDGIQRLGFTHGRVLEPALGIGHFFGLMPDDMRENSTLTGVEPDPTSAAIARALYPNSRISRQGFEQTSFADGHFDLAVSNVPFGNYTVFDPAFNRHHFLIHDYFFAKALDKVRPGGLVAFVTSMGTMDKADSGLRDYLYERSELLGAIRLPNTAFKRNANTEVTADILFLRRLEEGESPCGHDWRQLAEHTHAGNITFRINRYFADHPQMMCGTMAHERSMYGEGEPALVPDGRDLAEALRLAVSRLPQNVFRSIEMNLSEEQPAIIPAPPGTKEGGYVLHDGRIACCRNAELKIIEGLFGEATRRMRGLIEIRDSLRETIRTQLDELGEAAMVAARQQLNLCYDRFVLRFGPVNATANRRAFHDDPDFPLLCSLEDYRHDTKRATKTAIFRERTIHAASPVLRADSPKDALVVTLNERGVVNLPHMAELLQRSVDDFLPELKGILFLNPETRQWETEDQYLFGEVRTKLAVAREAAVEDPRFQENVAALESVQPEDLRPSEIEARLGAAWIPVRDISAFTSELLGGELVEVSHSPAVGTWFVRAGYQARSSVANTDEWGTIRYSALDLIQDSLNLKTPTVYDRDAQGNTYVNATETEAARERQEKIKERFKSWVWEDDERRERLARQYNDDFNSIRLPSFNGDHLTLPGSSNRITLRPHQKAAVWRIIQSKNTLLAHAVGAGKTFTMVAAGIEMKRLGLAKKPMFVVPNHMLDQFATELLALYPNANILAAGKDDFATDRRAELFSRIATGNWDAVIVTHSSFEKIPLDSDTRGNFIKDQIDEIKDAIREQKSGGSGTRLVKELERVQKRLEVKLETLSASEKKDSTLTFEELGVDRLFVDEAHKFKNLFYVTKMTRVAGLPQTASERAFDLFLKVRHIQDRNDGGGVVFATGTPISNTMAEMFTMQRYLQMNSLRRNGLQHFDSWAGTFGETVTAMELSPDGAGYRLNHRFARFVNVPELMQEFRRTADVRTVEMLKLPIPKLDTGRAITVSAPCSPALKSFVANLVERAAKLKGSRVDPKVDNMLKITSEGRLAALDMRLVERSSVDHPDSKVNLAVEKIHKIWMDSAANKGTQLVFCDLSTPQKGKSGWSVYGDIRDKLVERGIPAEEIVFIQNYDTDTAKAALFKSVRDGQVRVLLGSTFKMGEGTNVQSRLIALHHLDAPWRPSDIEQREGRILRQGNTNEYVGIFRYVTEGSFDAYMWQTLETKARFISQVMVGDATMRKAEDVDSTALSYAEVKAIASGNPMVLEKAQMDAEVIRLTRLKRQHMDSSHSLRARIRGIDDQSKRIGKFIENLEHDLSTRTPTRGELFSMTLGKETFTDRIEAGLKLVFMGASLKTYEETQKVGSIAGFGISLRNMGARVEVKLHGKNDYEATVSESPQGTIASIEHALGSLEKRLEESRDELPRLASQRKQLVSQVGLPFEHEDKLVAALNRQREIIDVLDITKNQATAQVDEGKETEAEAVKKKAPARSIRP